MSTDLERSITLSDGQVIRVRPIRPDDAPRLQRFQARLSERSLHYRFFGTVPRLGDDQALRLATVDHVNTLALVALDPADPEEIIGVVRFARDPGEEEAEIAIILADVFQGRGLGRSLIDAIIEAAQERGIPRLYGLVLADNARMIRLLRGLGFPHSSRWEGDHQRVVIEIELSSSGTA